MNHLQWSPAAMADRLTAEQRRLNMSRVRSKGTGPEIAVRRQLYALGYRFRLHRRDLPGTPDVVLPRHRVALFVHGCFWHGHECPLFRVPATRTEFWISKIENNRRRDAGARESLLAQGWRLLYIWECAQRGPGRLPDAAVSCQMTGFISSDLKEKHIAGKLAEESRPE